MPEPAQERPQPVLAVPHMCPSGGGFWVRTVMPEEQGRSGMCARGCGVGAESLGAEDAASVHRSHPSPVRMERLLPGSGAGAGPVSCLVNEGSL